MIPLLIRTLPRYGVDGIRVDQGAQRPAIDDQPGDEGAELRGREEVHFEHGHWVRSHRSVPELVDAQFGDCGLVGSVRFGDGDLIQGVGWEMPSLRKEEH